jgi:hypothetical protein
LIYRKILTFEAMAKVGELTITLDKNQKVRPALVTVVRSISDGWIQEERHVVAIGLLTRYHEVPPPQKFELSQRADALIGKNVLVRGMYAVVAPTEGEQVVPTVTFKTVVEDDNGVLLGELEQEDSNTSGLYEFDCRVRFQ